MNKTINTLQEVQESMNNIYNELATDQDKVKKEIYQIEGKMDYIASSDYISEDIKDMELKKLSQRLNVLMIKLMCEVEKDMKEMRNK